jgi:large subunit ribosomal protein L13
MKKAEQLKATFKTFSPKQGELNNEWLLVDVKDKVLGRVANKIADLLRGKGKTTFSGHLNVGDYVVVINAASIKLTGKKDQQKEYHRHSRYPGGLKTVTAGKLLEKKPEKVLEHAVAGMLPNNKNKNVLMGRLRIFAGAEHGHSAQNPKPIQL